MKALWGRERVRGLQSQNPWDCTLTQGRKYLSLRDGCHELFQGKDAVNWLSRAILESRSDAYLESMEHWVDVLVASDEMMWPKGQIPDTWAPGFLGSNRPPTRQASLLSGFGPQPHVSSRAPAVVRPEDNLLQEQGLLQMGRPCRLRPGHGWQGAAGKHCCWAGRQGGPAPGVNRATRTSLHLVIFYTTWPDALFFFSMRYVICSISCWLKKKKKAQTPPSWDVYIHTFSVASQLHFRELS